MWKVHIPFMWRHIGTLGHIAQVTQVALVHDLAEVSLGDTVDLHRVGLVHEVEQGRKCIAEADAAATAVADVEDSFKLRI